MEPIIMSRNSLIKGMNTNIYPSRLPGDFCYELLNGKIYSSVEGNSYVIQNSKGNEKAFSISDGYQIIGLKEYNEILYIVSARENDDYKTTSIEIGSFPSPKQMTFYYETTDKITFKFDEEEIGFEDVYKPLPSIDGGFTSISFGVSVKVFNGFRTNVFNFNADTLIFPLIKSSNDNTVNIYLNDGENPNRTVNNCFDEEGNIILGRCYKGVSYNQDDIEYTVDRITRQFLSVSKPPYAKLNKVEEGGKLPLGNLFVYIRYLDYEFNKTNFTPLIGPVVISNGDDIFTVSGNNPDGNINLSNKRIKIDVRYIDESYNFFEIAIAWKTSNDNVALGSRAMLLTKRVPITSDAEQDFVITGMEEMSEITLDEVITPALKETISMASTAFGDRWWGGNWKESDYNKSAMKELAKLVYIEPTLVSRDNLYDLNGEGMKDYSFTEVDTFGPNGINKKYWYQSPEFVVDRVGYYRGETYPFALQGLLEDGTYTDPFPITGFDFYYENDLNLNLATLDDVSFLSSDANTNNGFVRFPQFGTGDINSNIDSMDYILLAKAKLHRFWQYINNNPDLFVGISGFKVVRGERFKNLKYHGVNLPMIEYGVPSSVKTYLGMIRTREIQWIGDRAATSFPSIDMYPRYIDRYPLVENGIRYSLPGVYNADDATKYYVCYFEARTEKNRKAVYSPDNMLSNYNRLNDNENCYVYIPYSQYPQFGNQNDALGYYTYIQSGSYQDNIEHEVVRNGNYYSSRLNYVNYSSGRASIDNNYIRGITEKYSPVVTTENYFFTEIINYTDINNHSTKIWMLSDNDASYAWTPTQLSMEQAYIKAKATNVKENSYLVKNNYSSYFGDALFDSINVGFLSDGSDTARYGNSDAYSPEYLGLEYSENTSSYMFNVWKDSHMMPILVYDEPNDDSYYTDLVERYKPNGVIQLFGINYQSCSLFIDKNNDRTYDFNRYSDLAFDELYCNGDCFISRFSFRTLHNSKVFDLKYDETTDDYIEDIYWEHYNHGTLISIVLQSDSNTGLRAAADNNFYPLWASDWKPYTGSRNYNSVLCGRFGGGSMGITNEDFIYDWGHSETLPFNIYPGLDEIYKNDEVRFETRVRYTDKSFEEAYIDGWRSMYYTSRADYPNENGAIMILGYHGLYIIMVQERGTYQLFPNEKYVSQSQSQSGTEVVVGVGSILPDEYKPLADYGSQHTAFVQTNDYISGYDFNKSIWWKTGTYASGTTTSLGVLPISSNVSKYLIERKDNIIDPHIVLGRDEDEKDLYLTVRYRKQEFFDVSVVNGQTIISLGSDADKYDINGFVTVFAPVKPITYHNYDVYDYYQGILIINDDLSELILTDRIGLYLNCGYTIQQHENISSKENSFISRAGFAPTIYGTYKNNLISNDRLFDNDIWKHTDKTNRCTYYGSNSWFKYGIVVNASKEGQTFNQMIFGSLIAVSDNTPFDWIDYETEFQYSRHFPFYDENKFWITPEYRENKWDFTVPECLVSRGAAGYDPDSNMRGIWMKILIVYKGNLLKFVGDIVSKNIISNS